jgi:hypothetical protein
MHKINPGHTILETQDKKTVQRRLRFNFQTLHVQTRQHLTPERKHTLQVPHKSHLVDRVQYSWLHGWQELGGGGPLAPSSWGGKIKNKYANDRWFPKSHLTRKR